MVMCAHDGEGEGRWCYQCWTNIDTGVSRDPDYPYVMRSGCAKCGESWSEHKREGGVRVCWPEDELYGG